MMFSGRNDNIHTGLFNYKLESQAGFNYLYYEYCLTFGNYGMKCKFKDVFFCLQLVV